MDFFKLIFFKLTGINSLKKLQIWLFKVVVQLGHCNFVMYLFCYRKSSTLDENFTTVNVYIKQSQNQALIFLVDSHFIDIRVFRGIQSELLLTATTQFIFSLRPADLKRRWILITIYKTERLAEWLIKIFSILLYRNSIFYITINT